MNLNVRPVGMHPDIDSFVLTDGEQTLRYAHGPILPLEFSWPARDATRGLRAQIALHNGETRHLAIGGQWAWFRLLDRAVELNDAGEETVTLDFAGYPVKLALTLPEGAHQKRCCAASDVLKRLPSAEMADNSVYSTVTKGEFMPHYPPQLPGNASPSSDQIGIIIPEDSQRAMSTAHSWWRRQAGNAGAIAVRNAVSVAVPTAVREFLRRYAFSRIADGGASLALGSVAGYFPCVLEAGGLYRDINSHSYTRWTIAGRIACIILPGAGVTTLIAIGAMGSSAAAALAAANFVYTPLRDAIQHYVRREDNLAPDERCQRLSAAISAVAYMPNQFAVNAAMQYGTNALTPYAGTLGANIAARAGVNFLGECADDAVALGCASYFTGREAQTQVRFSSPATHTWNEVADRILNGHAGRSALFSSVLGAAYASDFAAAPGARNGHIALAIESAAVGGTAGLAYLPYALSVGQSPRREYDLEAAYGRRDSPAGPMSLTHFNRVRER